MPPVMWKAKAVALAKQLAAAKAAAKVAAKPPPPAKGGKAPAKVAAKFPAKVAAKPPPAARARVRRGGAAGGIGAGGPGAPPGAAAAGGGLGGLGAALAAVGAPGVLPGAPPPGGPAVAKAVAKPKAKAIAGGVPPVAGGLGALPGAAGAAPPGLAIVAAAAGPVASGTWQNLVNNPAALGAFAIAENDVLELALSNLAGTAWAGSVLFRVRKLDAADASGQFLMCDFCGCSDGNYGNALLPYFPRLNPSLYGGVDDQQAAQAPLAVVHLCLAGASVCQSTYGTMTVQHAELVRKREEQSITELWAKPYFAAAMSPTVQAKHPPGMPGWNCW